MATDVLTTADELLAISAAAKNRGERCELIAGEVRFMAPAGWEHGDTAGLLHVLLGRHIVDRKLGKVFTAETGFIIERDPDTVRAPDFAFIAKENLPAEMPTEAYWPGAPDFAVEVLSPNDRTGEVDEKIKAWLASGVKLLWVVDPQLKTITAYRSMTDIVVLTLGDAIEAPDVFPELRLDVSAIFA